MSVRVWIRAAATALVLLPASLAGAQPPASGDPVLARIGSTTVTVSAFRAEMARRGLTGAGVTQKHKEALLDEMVRAEAVAAKARTSGFLDRPEVQQAVRQVLVEAYLREHLLPRLAAVAVTDEDVKAHYAAHASEFQEPERRRAALVHVAVPSRATEDARAGLRLRALKAAAEIAGLPKGPLGAVAARYSDDQATRYTGGDMGWLVDDNTRYRFPAPVVKAVFALASPRDVSPVIAAENGFYVVRLLEVVPAGARPLEMVRDNIRQRLLQERRQALDRGLTDELRTSLAVSVDAKALAAVVPPPGEGVSGQRQPPSLPGR